MLTGEQIENIFKQVAQCLIQLDTGKKQWSLTQDDFQKIAEKLNKLLGNEKKIEYNGLAKQHELIHVYETLARQIQIFENKQSQDMKELTEKLDKIQEQLTSLSGENKKQSPQKETQEKNCLNCGNYEECEDETLCTFETVVTMDKWQPQKPPQEKSCATCVKEWKFTEDCQDCIKPSKQGVLFMNWQPKQESR